MSLKWLERLFAWLCRNAQNENWHKSIPWFPRITSDPGIAWLFPVWRRYLPSTDWEGSDWGYEWRINKDEG